MNVRCFLRQLQYPDFLSAEPLQPLERDKVLLKLILMRLASRGRVLILEFTQ